MEPGLTEGPFGYPIHRRTQNNDTGSVPPQVQPSLQLRQTSSVSMGELFSLFHVILLCIPYRVTGTKLRHIDVRNMNSDELFFWGLRDFYHHERSRWRHWLSLKTLVRIRFVYFNLYRSNLVDVLKSNDIPPEAKRDEYHYKPMPAAVVPPIGENHLKHLFDHPWEADKFPVCISMIPKRQNNLKVLPFHITAPGWGLHFLEGLHWTKLWALGFAGLVVSTAFGVIWTALRDDIQGAFAVTSCMMVGMVFTTGIIQAAFEQKHLTSLKET